MSILWRILKWNGAIEKRDFAAIGAREKMLAALPSVNGRPKTNSMKYIPPKRMLFLR
jgi:hypothetical protein